MLAAEADVVEIIGGVVGGVEWIAKILRCSASSGLASDPTAITVGRAGGQSHRSFAQKERLRRAIGDLRHLHKTAGRDAAGLVLHLGENAVAGEGAVRAAIAQAIGKGLATDRDLKVISSSARPHHTVVVRRWISIHTATIRIPVFQRCGARWAKQGVDNSVPHRGVVSMVKAYVKVVPVVERLFLEQRKHEDNPAGAHNEGSACRISGCRIFWKNVFL